MDLTRNDVHSKASTAGALTLGRPLFTFGIISDGHINPEEETSSSPWESNRHANGRNRYAVRELNRYDPDFVIHLGDMVHPVPVMPTYRAAVENFKRIFGELRCPLYLVPGNHDVGDKPSSWVPAEAVNPEYIQRFGRWFSEDHLAFDWKECRFVLFNCQLLNSGLPREIEQRRWLEKELQANEGKRIFLFVHYPPYLTAPDEPEHYDNLQEPGRSWLLDLLPQHGVAALFCGHVHNFFYNRYGMTDCFVLPSVTFVRHDYSEMFRVAAAEEHGRNDTGKLGFALVRVHEKGHLVELIRTWGRTSGPDAKPASAMPAPHPPLPVREIPEWRVGLDLRHPWAEITEMPYSGALDEFCRKRVRNDYPLWALWEMGVRRLRIPLQDLADSRVRNRVQDLRRMGHQFHLFLYDLPQPTVRDMLIEHQDLIVALEIILPWGRLHDRIAEIRDIRRRMASPVFLSKLRSSADAEREGDRFAHFVKHGFQPEEVDEIVKVLELAGSKDAFDGCVFRVGRDRDPWVEIPRISALAERLEILAQVQVMLASENPAVMEGDDRANASRVALSIAAARTHSRVRVFLDTFMDLDRGYFPRTGLIDRRSNLRLAGWLYLLMSDALDAMDGDLSPGEIIERPDGTLFTLKGDGERVALILPKESMQMEALEMEGPANGSEGIGRCIDLFSGDERLVSWNSAPDERRRIQLSKYLRIETPTLIRL